jgi:branched-subunit amino acid transport protein
MTDGTSPWLALLVGALVTYLWRGLGVVLSGRISPDGAAIQWVGCVAYALLAALVARMIVLPSGALADVALWIRLTAAAVGTIAFLALRSNVVAGVAAGVATLSLLHGLV